MRNLLLLPLALFSIFIIPKTVFSQVPDLGAASGFALFTAAGAFSNDGSTSVTGDIGTNVGAFTGFPPGIVNGQIHVADAVAAQAALDVDLAYGSLSPITCGLVIGTTLGNGQILTPNVYCLGAASTLNGDLVLDGQCNPDALFIIKINGALSTTSGSRIILTNSASLCNVYWQINGALEVGPGSTFRGTALVNGAISLLEGAALFGRGLSRQGAIALHNNTVDNNLQPAASVIVASGPTTFCAGGSVTLVGNCGGVWSNGATTASIPSVPVEVIQLQTQIIVAVQFRIKLQSLSIPYRPVPFQATRPSARASRPNCVRLPEPLLTSGTLEQRPIALPSARQVLSP